MAQAAKTRDRGPKKAGNAPFVPAALRHLRRSGGAMPGLISCHGAPEFQRTRNSFQSLGRAIVYQQLSGAAAGTIYERFVDLFEPRRFPTPPQLLATSPDDLRGAGLSWAKVSFLHDLARAFEAGEVNPRRFGNASDDAIGEMLLGVKGIGQWSVDMFLMFGLNRPDVLPVGDLGVRRGMMRYFRKRSLPSPKDMRRLAAPWAPYRSVASWYMWRVAEDGLP